MSQCLVLDYAAVDNDKAVTPEAAKQEYDRGVRVVGIRRSVTYYDAAHKAYVMSLDHTYERDIQVWRDAGMVVFAYDFPAFGVGAPSQEDQTALFYGSGNTTLDFRPGIDIPPEFDLEFPGRGIVDTGRSQAEVLALAEQRAMAHERRLSAMAGVTTGIAPGVYTSHVEMHDTNGLGLKTHQSTTLARGDLWQKIPYPVHAGSPLVDHFGSPHSGYQSWDRGDLWRIPDPWEQQQTSPWLVQGQGDARGLLSNTVDVGYFVVMRKGEQGGRVRKIQRRIGMAEGTPGVFDDVMENFVKSWQAKNKLEDDGVIGPRSYALAASLPVPDVA